MTTRRPRFHVAEDRALALLARAPAVQFAASLDSDAPLLRTLTAVMVDGRLCFHGGDHGEKLGLIGRRVVAGYSEVVAQVASYWIHPEMACPASTYYRSVLAEGPVRRVTDLDRKARILGALMERFQPEGRYLPIAGQERYRAVLERLLVAEMILERVSGNEKLGQHRSAREICGVLEGLWRRGERGDLPALRAIREAHPERPLPDLLRGPQDSVLCVAPDGEDARAVQALLQGQYWTTAWSADEFVRAHLGSDAWVVARAGEAGPVIGSARAVSDAGRFAHIMDVIVRPDYRGRGVGMALMRLLLDHPRLRGVRRISLGTRDAQGFYARLAFTPMHTPADIAAMQLTRR